MSSPHLVSGEVTRGRFLWPQEALVQASSLFLTPQLLLAFLFMVGLSFLDWPKCGLALADFGRTKPQLISGASHVVVTVARVVERPSCCLNYQAWGTGRRKKLKQPFVGYSRTTPHQSWLAGWKGSSGISCVKNSR